MTLVKQMKIEPPKWRKRPRIPIEQFKEKNKVIELNFKKPVGGKVQTTGEHWDWKWSEKCGNKGKTTHNTWDRMDWELPLGLNPPSQRRNSCCSYKNENVVDSSIPMILYNFSRLDP